LPCHLLILCISNLKSQISNLISIIYYPPISPSPCLPFFLKAAGDEDVVIISFDDA
jgi:hypothetical protein